MEHRATFDWAHTHLERLQSSIGAFRSKKPHRVVHQYDAVSQQELVRIRVDRAQPGDWIFIIGDYIHNLRIALDHLAWQLVTAHTPVPANERRVQFPIHPTSASFHQPAVPGVREAAPEVQKAVEELQPYNGWNSPEPHPLLVLNGLENIHKHRHPLAAGTVLTDSSFSVREDPYGRLCLRTGDDVRFGPFEDGAVIASYTFDPPGPAPEVKMKFQIATDVAFSQEGPARGAPVIQTLERIRDHLRDVVFPKLEPFLRS